MDLLNEVTMKASLDKNVSVSLTLKSIIVDGQLWVRNGEVTEHAPSKELCVSPNGSAIDSLEKLFEVYKYSYPSESETKRKRCYFKAKTAEEMTTEELVTGLPRYVTRIALEAAVLLYAMSGYLKWDESWGSWYYKGKDSDFILLREWVE